MTLNLHPDERIRLLVSNLIDGELSPDEIAELNQLVQTDARYAELLVDQLLLDSLLSEGVGAESLTALVDLAGVEAAHPLPEHMNSAAAPAELDVVGLGHGVNAFDSNLSRRSLQRSRLGSKIIVWVALVAGVVGLGVLVGRWDNNAFADAAVVVQAAIEAHAEPLERVYVVRTEHAAATDVESQPPRDVRVTTQGDRFYVEMNRGERRWYWGLDADGAIWLTVGPRRAVVVAQDEVGVPLQYISNLYTLNLETLLQNFLKHCQLDDSAGTEVTHVITATPKRRWPGGLLRKAVIEVDRETKAVRKLTITRELPQRGASTVTFTLIESRVADETRYRPEGHLSEPFRLLTRDSQPDARRKLLVSWFGPAAERWIAAESIGSQAPGNE